MTAPTRRVTGRDKKGATHDHAAHRNIRNAAASHHHTLLMACAECGRPRSLWRRRVPRSRGPERQRVAMVPAPRQRAGWLLCLLAMRLCPGKRNGLVPTPARGSTGFQRTSRILRTPAAHRWRGRSGHLCREPLHTWLPIRRRVGMEGCSRDIALYSSDGNHSADPANSTLSPAHCGAQRFCKQTGSPLSHPGPPPSSRFQQRPLVQSTFRTGL